MSNHINPPKEVNLTSVDWWYAVAKPISFQLLRQERPSKIVSNINFNNLEILLTWFLVSFPFLYWEQFGH